MPYIPIDPDTLKVGDPITKELLDLVENNFSDHEERINQGETTVGGFAVFNGDISLEGLDASDPYIFYYKARQNFSVNDVRAQLFTKDGLTTGVLGIDVQKSTDTNNANFNTILSGDLEFDYAVDAAYTERNATINAGVSSLTAGDVLRVEITSTPANFVGKVLLTIGAE